MYVAKIENVKGNILMLSNNESNWSIESIIGLNPPKAQINTSTIAMLDGAKFNSSKLDTRNIVITLKLNGAGTHVEANRQLLYSFFPTKQWCKFYFKNEYRDVSIEAYVENFECDLFQRGQIAQISLLCPQPYFQSMDEILTDISKVINDFEFPFAFGSVGATNPGAIILSETDNAIAFSTIDSNKVTDVVNNSESETGVLIHINVLGAVNTIKIQNTETGETFTIDYSFQENDVITINTYKGSKGITLVREGVTINLFPYMRSGSTFFQLQLGDNFFSYMADDGDKDNLINIVFEYHNVFRGV